MHTRKRDKSKPIEMQDLAGSAKLTDLADNVLAMAKCNATEVYVKVLKSRSNAIPDKVRYFKIRSDGYLHLEFIRECEEEDLLAQGKKQAYTRGGTGDSHPAWKRILRQENSRSYETVKICC